MANKTVDDILAHHGIKGMRWGIVRSRKQLEAARSPDSASAASAAKKAKKTGVASLSNAELNDLNKRLRLEQEYAKLTGAKTNRGRQFINGVLKSAETANRVYTVMNGPAGSAVRAQIKKKTTK